MTPTDIQKYSKVSTNMENDDYLEDYPMEFCPKCGCEYDDIDFDYQICSLCGWDAEAKTFVDDEEGFFNQSI